MSEETSHFISRCPTCNKIKNYKNLISFNSCKDKNCKSCANSILQGGKGNIYTTKGLKECIDCNLVLPLDNFYNYKNSNKVLSICKNCNKKRNSKYHIEYYRFKKYNLTKEDFLNLKNKQDNTCAICNENKKLYIDHCHITNKVRGLLYRECNSSLGLLKENINSLNNMIKYIIKYG